MNTKTKGLLGAAPLRSVASVAGSERGRGLGGGRVLGGRLRLNRDLHGGIPSWTPPVAAWRSPSRPETVPAPRRGPARSPAGPGRRPSPDRLASDRRENGRRARPDAIRPDRMPSGPTGTRTHAGEAALETDAVPRTPPVEEWPFRTEKRAFRFPRGQAPEKKCPEKKCPETSRPPRRAGHRAKRAHPSRQRAHLSHAPDRPGVFSVQACAQTRSRTYRRHT
ncbi:hypothetical protein GGP91_002874 [Salinibacter ruber]|nr:hypothetical protein [Salinibacter ruber]MCS4057396.1 hypothetical protein [Salinibacter ruber]MCS4060874.1 hypothetical protein [Salinibacter ruber]MCS4103296.1 hypothetical protein [Salinibacter ruber]MCS4162491.1 hypothetical protein [Salinibacter ruber]